MVDDIRKLLIEVPKRAQYLRVIIMELARITDHLICNSILVLIQVPILDLYVFQFREKVYEIYEEICGACLTTNMGSNWWLKERLVSKAFELLDTSW
jgi:NADH-quinone oxidoreductase subunit D